MLKKLFYLEGVAMKMRFGEGTPAPFRRSEDAVAGQAPALIPTPAACGEGEGRGGWDRLADLAWSRQVSLSIACSIYFFYLQSLGKVQSSRFQGQSQLWAEFAQKCRKRAGIFAAFCTILRHCSLIPAFFWKIFFYSEACRSCLEEKSRDMAGGEVACHTPAGKPRTHSSFINKLQENLPETSNLVIKMSKPS
jgi:hypothetical protein